jgi:hypothetical protein
MDFTQDPEVITSYLAMVKRDWNKAKESFVELSKHWESLGSDFFPGVSVNRSADGTTVTGDVLGKHFSINIGPLASDKACFAEVLVEVKFSGNAQFEAARFLLNRRGQVVDDEGAVQIDTESGEGSARVFASILRTVIQQPAPLLQVQVQPL